MKRLLLIVLPLLLIVGCSKPVDETSLVEKDGMMYLPNSDKPYTGEVFNNYSTGEKEYQGTYENGLLVSYSFLNKDGSLKEPINYETTLVEREGVFYTKDTNKPYSGQVFFLYDDGKKKEEGIFKDGKKDGLFKVWYENGQKMYEGTYKDNVINGLGRKWYDNGQQESEVNFIDGEKQGVQIGWYKNGQKEFEFVKDGVCTEWYKDGQKKYEGNNINGKHEGEWMSWSPNGLDKILIEYKNGEILNGTFTTWYENGQKEEEGNYKDGEKDGLWISWDENGQILSDETYDDGFRVSTKEERNWTPWEKVQNDLERKLEQLERRESDSE